MPLFLAALFLFILGGCREAASPAVEYEPGKAGTVDHALCLLGFSAIPLRELATGHHLVEADLNGVRGIFVVDTGANVTVLHAALAEQFGLARQGSLRAGAIGIGGPTDARQVAIQSLSMGGIDLRHDRIVLADLSHVTGPLGSASDTRIAGIIGQDVLQEHRAVIDVAKPLLYLIEEDEAPSPVPAETCTVAEEQGAADGEGAPAKGEEPRH